MCTVFDAIYCVYVHKISVVWVVKGMQAAATYFIYSTQQSKEYHYIIYVFRMGAQFTQFIRI